MEPFCLRSRATNSRQSHGPCQIFCSGSPSQPAAAQKAPAVLYRGPAATSVPVSRSGRNSGGTSQSDPTANPQARPVEFLLRTAPLDRKNGVLTGNLECVRLEETEDRRQTRIALSSRSPGNLPGREIPAPIRSLVTRFTAPAAEGVYWCSAPRCLPVSARRRWRNGSGGAVRAGGGTSRLHRTRCSAGDVIPAGKAPAGSANPGESFLRLPPGSVGAVTSLPAFC